jgi:hypothetical protein
MLQLTADPKCNVEAIVLESTLHQGQGCVFSPFFWAGVVDFRDCVYSSIEIVSRNRRPELTTGTYFCVDLLHHARVNPNDLKF